MSIKLSTNNLSLGQLKVGQPKSFNIQLINDSDKEELITSIRTGCSSCTTAKAESDKIPANGKVQMTIVFTPKSTGINRKTVTINGSIILNFNANVY